MTQPEAIEILINAAGAAQKAGVFSLADARYVMDAIDVARPTPTPMPSTEPAPLPAESTQSDESVPTEATA